MRTKAVVKLTAFVTTSNTHKGEHRDHHLHRQAIHPQRHRRTGDTILEMSATDVQFKMDLTKAAINGHKLTKLISDLVKKARKPR